MKKSRFRFVKPLAGAIIFGALCAGCDKVDYKERPIRSPPELRRPLTNCTAFDHKQQFAKQQIIAKGGPEAEKRGNPLAIAALIVAGMFGCAAAELSDAKQLGKTFKEAVKGFKSRVS